MRAGERLHARRARLRFPEQPPTATVLFGPGTWEPKRSVVWPGPTVAALFDGAPQAWYSLLHIAYGSLEPKCDFA